VVTRGAWPSRGRDAAAGTTVAPTAIDLSFYFACVCGPFLCFLRLFAAIQPIGVNLRPSAVGLSVFVLIRGLSRRLVRHSFSDGGSPCGGGSIRGFQLLFLFAKGQPQRKRFAEQIRSF